MILQFDPTRPPATEAVPRDLETTVSMVMAIYRAGPRSARYQVLEQFIHKLYDRMVKGGA